MLKSLSFSLVTLAAIPTPLLSIELGLTLPNSTASDWWYGCGPTSAGMLMAYYDINGYGGYTYDNLVPGGTPTPALGAYPNGQLLRNIIASEGHQRDYYNAATYGYNNGGGETSLGYDVAGDDLPVPTHADDCLADFMGTSRDSDGGSNGCTQLYVNDTGVRFDYTGGLLDLGAGLGVIRDVCYGIQAYVEYCGYSLASSFTQNTDIYCDTHNLDAEGFGFADYCAEIDAGRPMLIGMVGDIGGHLVLGIGYDETSSTLEYLNTWDGDIHSMAWDGTLLDMSLYAVYGMELAPVPEPAACAAGAGVAALLLAALRRRRRPA